MKQNNISAKEAAQVMYLAPSTLSMWKKKGAIPDQQLVNVAQFLKNSEFSAQVSNYLFGLPTVIEDKSLNADPLSLWVHLKNVEKNKSSIFADLTEVLNHSNFNFDDREIAIHAIQLMRTEAVIENHLSNLLIDKYTVTEKELSPQESKLAKFRNRPLNGDRNRQFSK